MTFKYRIANRFRFTVFVVITIIALTIIANMILGLGTAQGSTVQEFRTVTVNTGDTLWSIAETYMPESMDTREAVYVITSVNELSGSDIYAGMQLQIPVYTEI